MIPRTDYKRDSHSGALLKRDRDALLKDRARKMEMRRLSDAEKEIHSLREEIHELKALLMKGKD